MSPHSEVGSDVDQAEKTYLDAINEQSKNADALLGLARVSQSRGNANAALEYLSRAKELLADSPDRLYKFAVAAFGLSTVASWLRVAQAEELFRRPRLA